MSFDLMDEARSHMPIRDQLQLEAEDEMRNLLTASGWFEDDQMSRHTREETWTDGEGTFLNLWDSYLKVKEMRHDYPSDEA